MSSAFRVWGHRGCRGLNNPPENTMAAFHAAVAQDADGIEFDVFLTADGHIVVFHDEDVRALTNGKGAIKKKTLAELQKLKVGGTEESIPTLQEVLDGIGPRQGFTYNIEIKDPDSIQGTAAIVKACLAQGFGPEHFLISSFHRTRLPEMAQAFGQEIRLGALYDRGEKLERYTTYSIHVPLQSLNAELIAQMNALGSVSVAWTSKEKSPAKNKDIWKIKQFSCPIITDYPKEMREALNGIA